jgi:hypothetical protein
MAGIYYAAATTWTVLATLATVGSGSDVKFLRAESCMPSHQVRPIVVVRRCRVTISAEIVVWPQNVSIGDDTFFKRAKNTLLL